jgi:hypothetical protein
VGPGQHLRARITCDAARLFDGLEFAADTPDALAWGVLENLFDHAAVEVHLTDD